MELTNISICMKDSVSKFRPEGRRKKKAKLREKYTRNVIHPIEMFILTLLGNLTLIFLTHRENKEVRKRKRNGIMTQRIALKGFFSNNNKKLCIHVNTKHDMV